MIFKQYYKNILISSTLLAVIVFFVASVFIPSKYESQTVIYVSKPSVFIPESMREDSDWEFPVITEDNLRRLINDKKIQKEIGLKLLAIHLTLRNANPDIISAKHFKKLRSSIPSEILSLAGETDSITYLNLVSQADEHPFLIEINHHSDISYYSNKAISSVSVARVINTNMITLSYLSDDAGVGGQMLDIILNICMRHFEKISANRFEEIVSYCEEQFCDVQCELQISERKLLKNKNTAISQREDILNRLVSEREKILETENSIKNIENQISIQNFTIKNQNIVGKLKVLNSLYHQRVENANMDTAALQLQINKIKQDIKNEINTMITSLPGDGATKEKVIEEYNNNVITRERNKVQLSALERQRKELYSSEKLTSKELEEIEIYDQKYSNALEELNKSKRYQQSQSTALPMLITEKPYHRLINGNTVVLWALLSGVVGFFLFYSFIVLKTSFNKKLKTPDKAEQQTGLKVVGIIPNHKQLQSYKHSHHIKNSLMYHMLWNFFQTAQKQHRVLVTSIYPEEEKTNVCNMISDWLFRKGKKCKIVTPCFENAKWWVKTQDIFETTELLSIESLSENDVLIMKLSPLIMGEYPIELIRKFNTTFLVCDAQKEWLSFERKTLDNFVGQTKHIPQIILNNVNMDIVEDLLGTINLVKTHFASPKRSSQRMIRREHKLVNSKHQAQQIIKAMPNLGVILNKNRQIVYANEAITSLLGLGNMNKTLGLRPGELVSCVYSDVTASGCGTSKACQNCGAVNTIVRCIKSRKYEEGECRINSFMNGQLVPFMFKISCTPFEVNGDFFVITNLADIKGKEDKRRQLLNETIIDAEPKGDLSALSNLIEKVQESEQLDSLLDTLEQISTPISEEIADLQRLNEAENGVLKIQLTSIGAFNILDNVVRSVRAKQVAQDKKISMAPPFPAISFLTDTDILEQILRNMLKNAIEIAPSGGTVYFGYEKTKYAITFYISNKVFIPDHLQSSIFQNKEKKIGFYMYGMKLLGEQFLRGCVGFTSTKELGTRFYITLPLSAS